MLAEIIVLAGLTTSSGLGFEGEAPGASVAAESRHLAARVDWAIVEKIDGGSGTSLTGELLLRKPLGRWWIGAGGVATELRVGRYDESGEWFEVAAGLDAWPGQWRLGYEPSSGPKDQDRVELQVRTEGSWPVEARIAHSTFNQPDSRGGWSVSIGAGYRWGKR